MTIANVTLALHAWKKLPTICDGARAAGGGETSMDLLAIGTDEGITGPPSSTERQGGAFQRQAAR